MWILMWLNMSVIIINTTLQFLDIYRYVMCLIFFFPSFNTLVSLEKKKKKKKHLEDSIW